VLLQRRIRTLAYVQGLVELGDGLRAPVVIAADGANSTLRRLLGLAPNPPGASAIAMRGYAAGTGREPEQLIEMVAAGWPAYAWSFPIDGPGHEARANVGFGMLRTSLAAGDEPGRKALAGPLSALLPDQPADPASLRAHHLPLSTFRPRQPDGRVLLVGDAASLINPLTGEGIYYAVLSGRLAGRAAVDPGGAAAGAAYRRALRRELGLHLATTSALYRLARSPEFFDAGLALADRDPAAMDVLVEIGLGRGTLPPRLLVRLARRALVISGRRLLRSEASQVARYGRRIRVPLTGPFSYVRHLFHRHQFDRHQFDRHRFDSHRSRPGRRIG
jgi:flavin-dependent dehydrogenase